MKPAAAVLGGLTLLCLIVALVTGSSADSYGPAAANSAALSNVMLTLTGVGVTGLLVMWGVATELGERLARPQSRSKDIGPVWSKDA